MFRPRSTVSLAATVALLAVVAPYSSLSSFTAIAAPATFDAPITVSSDTKLLVSSGSDAMTVISEALKTSFEGKFDGAEVNVDAMGADRAIQSLLVGDADLAAISRPLTTAETEQGLAAVDVQRIKIAVIVGADNPFTGGLNSEQFAKIFRGEITNWSEVGGPNTPIRLIDRPDTSETRLALAAYPVFKAAEFATGETASQLETDSAADIAKGLGTDGIGYVLVDQVNDLAGVRTLSMHKTLPSDARYPFSQPFSLIYSGEPSPAVAAFLGYATGAPGQSALTSVNPLAGVVSAAGNTVKGAADVAGNALEGVTDAAGGAVQSAAGVAGNTIDNTAGTAGNALEGATDAAGAAVEGAADVAGNALEGAADVAGNAANQVTAAAEQPVSDRNPKSQTRINLWWLMVVPAACLGLVAWGSRRRKDANMASVTTDGALSSVGNVGTATAAGAVAAGGTAWAAAKQGGNVAKDGLGNVGATAKDGLDHLKGGLDNVGDAAKGGLGSVKGGLDNVGDVAKGGLGGVKAGLGNVSDAAKGGFGSIQDGLGHMGDAAKGGLGKVGDVAQGSLDNVQGAAQQGVDGIKGGLGSAGNAVQGGISSLGDGVNGGFDSVGNTLQGGAGAATDKLSGMTDAASNTVKNVANDAKEGSQPLWQRVRSGVNQVGNQAGNLKDKASDVADDLKDMGK